MSRATTRSADAERDSRPVERFDPGQLTDELVEAEHLVRYLWAAPLAADRDVLDVGCGTGYGCGILAAAGARRCIGVDISEEAIERARAAHADDTAVLEFKVADATALPLEDAGFDLVTCFETIEHLADQEALIAECARVLRPGGSLLISSPNRDEYPPGNPYHVKELTPVELEALLGRLFGHVLLLRQHNWLTSAILDDPAFAADDSDARLELEARKLQGREPGHELYTLAVCSNQPVSAPASQALLTHALEVRKWLDDLDRRQRELEHYAAEIERHEVTIRSLGDELSQTRKALATTEQDLLELRDRRSTAMGRLEHQAYWLERAELDLDAWMRRRPVRVLFRALSRLLRLRRKLGRPG